MSAGTIVSRCLSYVLLGALLAMVPSLDLAVGMQAFNDLYYTEISFVELGQKLALTAGLVLTVLAIRRGWMWELNSLLAALLGGALIREFDFMFDLWFDGAWQLMLTLTLLSAGGYLWPRRAALQQQLNELTQHFSFGLMLAGSMIVLGFSRIFGRGDYWRRLLGEDYDRSVKNLAEESMELLGFWIIAMGVAELTLAARRRFGERSRVTTHGSSVGAS